MPGWPMLLTSCADSLPADRIFLSHPEEPSMLTDHPLAQISLAPGARILLETMQRFASSARIPAHTSYLVLQRCIRKHVAVTFGFSPTGAVLAPPTQQFKDHILWTVNQGGIVGKPYIYNWNSPPSALYNVCIESSFSVDFWTAAKSGLYDLEYIPRRYQRRKPFIKALRTYLHHIKRMLRLASATHSSQLAFAQHCAATSRKATVSVTFCVFHLVRLAVFL